MLAAGVLVGARVPRVALAGEPRHRVRQGALRVGPSAGVVGALPADAHPAGVRLYGGRAVALGAERADHGGRRQAVELDLETMTDLSRVVRNVEVAQRPVDDRRLRPRCPRAGEDAERERRQRPAATSQPPAPRRPSLHLALHCSPILLMCVRAMPVRRRRATGVPAVLAARRAAALSAARIVWGIRPSPWGDWRSAMLPSCPPLPADRE